MGKLERVTVTVPEEMVAKLRAAVEAGEYATTSEIVLEALHDWEKLQERRQVALQNLREQVEEGMKGPFLDGPAAMTSLQERVGREAKRRGAL